VDSLARNQIRIDASLTNAIVGCEFVVSGRDTPTLLDLVKEPFDQVARAIRKPARELFWQLPIE
jgi:hypothetical protein